MASVASNKIKQMLLNASVDFGVDTFKIILMLSGFTFSAANHRKYADVISSEVATNYGYTQGDKILGGVTVTEDDGSGRGEVTWNDVSWSISGGAVTASGAIIYDDSVTSPAGEVDAIVGYVDFDGDQTITSGGAFAVNNIAIRIS